MVAGGVFVLAGVLVSIFIGCGRVCCKKSGCKLNILGGVFYLVGGELERLFVNSISKTKSSFFRYKKEWNFKWKLMFLKKSW